MKNVEVEIDSWEKLEAIGYEKVLSKIGDRDIGDMGDMDIEIILPKKCKDGMKERKHIETFYAEADRIGQKVRGEEFDAAGAWLKTWKDGAFLTLRGVGALGSIVMAIGAPVLAPVIAGFYAIVETAMSTSVISDKEILYREFKRKLENPKENLKIEFLYTDKPDEMRNKILLPHDSLDKVREKHPGAYEELKKLMDGNCALRKYDFVEEFGEKFPEAFKELERGAMEQRPYDYNSHTRKMK